MIQANLGVECTVKIFESFGEQLDAFAALGADDEGFILGLGWGADNPTLANMIAPLFGTGSGSNYTGYSNPEFDKLIAEGNQAADEATASPSGRRLRPSSTRTSPVTAPSGATTSAATRPTCPT